MSEREIHRNEAAIHFRSTTPWLKTFIPILAAVLGLAALRLLGGDVLNPEKLSNWMRPLGVFAPVVFTSFLAIRPITLLPGQLFTAVSGLLFGTLWGSVYSLLGSFLGVLVVYAVSKKFGTSRVKRWAGDGYRALHEAARDNDFAWAFATCINPLVPTDVTVAMAAASGARFWPTALGVFLGTIPGTFLTAQFGSALWRGHTTLGLVSVVGLIISMVIGFHVGRRVLDKFHRADGGAQKRLSQRSTSASGLPAPVPR